MNASGSSPLTRGKQRSPRDEIPWRGLIPAHAGKTCSSLMIVIGFPAHPRSRGENWFADAARGVSEGSSPLTRGKPLKGWVREADNGLIPAHAGKTMASISAAV